MFPQEPTGEEEEDEEGRGILRWRIALNLSKMMSWLLGLADSLVDGVG